MIMMIKTSDTRDGPQAKFLVDEDAEAGVDQCECGNDKFIGHRTCKDARSRTADTRSPSSRDRSRARSAATDGNRGLRSVRAAQNCEG